MMMHLEQRRYADDIDFMQIGNEAFSGAGAYWFDAYNGSIKCVPADDFDDVCGDMVEWIEAQADAVRFGSALAGRPLQIISPATAYDSLTKAVQGDSSDTLNMDPGLDCGGAGDDDDLNNRAARALRCIVESANRNDYLVDLHFHFAIFPQSQAMVEAVQNPVNPNTSWPAPEGLVALEYGPVPSSISEEDDDGVVENWWQKPSGPDLLTGKQRTEEFYDSDPNNNDAQDWNAWVAMWLDEDGLAVLPGSPEHFLTTGIDDLRDRGFRIVCYADSSHGEGGAARTFDLSSLWPSRSIPQLSPPGLSVWNTHLQSAIAPLAQALDNAGWAPRPAAWTSLDGHCGDCP